MVIVYAVKKLVNKKSINSNTILIILCIFELLLFVLISPELPVLEKSNLRPLSPVPKAELSQLENLKSLNKVLFFIMLSI